MAETININDVLEGQVVLDLDCLDRIYLSACVPNLQVGGQLVRFLTGHRGNPVPSPALFERMGNRLREAVRDLAQSRAILVLRPKKPDRSHWDDRKLDHVRPYLEQARQPGVVAIVDGLTPREHPGLLRPLARRHPHAPRPEGSRS